jgi:hypothetical protein
MDSRLSHRSPSFHIAFSARIAKVIGGDRQTSSTIMAHLIKSLDTLCEYELDLRVPASIPLLRSKSVRDIERGMAMVEEYRIFTGEEKWGGKLEYKKKFSEYYRRNTIRVTNPTPSDYPCLAFGDYPARGNMETADQCIAQIHKLISDIYRGLSFDNEGSSTSDGSRVLELTETLAATQRRLKKAKDTIDRMHGALGIDPRGLGQAGKDDEDDSPPPAYTPPK